ELGAGDSVTRVLALWGLALALDRSGDHREAIASARLAIQGDPFAAPSPDDARFGIDREAHGPTALLHSRLVFFEPAYEIYGYDAIGWEALASEEGGASRDELLVRARRSWAAFLAGGGNAGIYGAHATAALARVSRP